MGYADISKSPRKSVEGWMDAVRSVFGIGRKSVNTTTVAPVSLVAPTNTYTQKDGEVALAFRIGVRYYHAGKNRVFECIALKGKRARSVAFGCLDKVEEDKAALRGVDRELYTWMWHKVRIDGGAETCERGALRADRQATESEVAGELDFLRKLRQREKDYKPGVSFKVEISGG